MKKKKFSIFAGEKSKHLTKLICEHLGVPMGKMIVDHFADGEFSVSFEESVRGKDVFLIQSTMPSQDNFMELLLMVDAAKRASAKSIIAVIPYYGWARQDRKDKPRVAIGAKVVADCLTAVGINRLMTMDLHADQEQGFFNVPVDHLYASSVLLPYIQSLKLPDLVIASADVGGSKRANKYAKYLKVPFILCNKHRDNPNSIDEMQVIGDCDGKNVIIIDDMVDTGGTITMAADCIIKAGATSVRALASHCIMSDPACERVMSSALEEIVFTDTIPFTRDCPKLKQLSVAPIFAETIKRVLKEESISDLYVIK